MRVLFCGYRDWAVNAYMTLWSRHDIDIELARNPAELQSNVDRTHFDVIVLAGWSWKVSDDVLDASYVIGMHPSDLPAFAGGSPIQNQIINGIKRTNASLFRLTPTLDAGPIVGKCPLNLEGHMSDIFKELERVTVELVDSFLKQYPNVNEVPQTTGGNHVKRLKPDQSHMTPSRLGEMTCAQLYDEIRCREDPYPNVYLEDETGRLYFKLVEFEPKQ